MIGAALELLAPLLLVLFVADSLFLAKYDDESGGLVVAHQRFEWTSGVLSWVRRRVGKVVE
jgi:hypothetical protein